MPFYCRENLYYDTLLIWQIHERLKRFEKRSPIPVQEHAASLASDVSNSLQTSFADRHRRGWQFDSRGNGEDFSLLKPFPLLHRWLSCHTEARVKRTFPLMCAELWNVVSKLCHLRCYRLKGNVLKQISFCICLPAVRSLRTEPSKRLLKPFCV